MVSLKMPAPASEIPFRISFGDHVGAFFNFFVLSCLHRFQRLSGLYPGRVPGSAWHSVAHE